MVYVILHIQLLFAERLSRSYAANVLEHVITEKARIASQSFEFEERRR